VILCRMFAAWKRVPEFKVGVGSDGTADIRDILQPSLRD
jgi:hypothetical protein